jgi:hypothetical protein
MATRAHQRLVVSHRRLSQSDAAIPEKIIENLPVKSIGEDDRSTRNSKPEMEISLVTDAEIRGRGKTSLSDVVAYTFDICAFSFRPRHESGGMRKISQRRAAPEPHGSLGGRRRCFPPVSRADVFANPSRATECARGEVTRCGRVARDTSPGYERKALHASRLG